jgi:hypothetical protein
VFFTAPDYDKAKAVKIEALVQMGAEWPTEVNQRYFANIIGPPRGDCKSIRHMFGYEERPAAIQHAGTPLTKMSADALSLIVGFVVTPLTTPDLCSLAKTFARATLSPQAWRGCDVDTNGLKPAGSKSHRHYELWKQAKRIVSGSLGVCERGSSSLERFQDLALGHEQNVVALHQDLRCHRLRIEYPRQLFCNRESGNAGGLDVRSRDF